MRAQLSADVEVRRVEGCYVGFHGVLLKRGGPSQLELLQRPAAPDSSAPLLTLWALGLIPPDFETEGASTWPFRLPLVSRHDIAAIWVAFFSRRQRYRC